MKPLEIAEHWQALANYADWDVPESIEGLVNCGFSSAEAALAAAGALRSMWKVHAAQFTDMAGHDCANNPYHLCAAITALCELEPGNVQENVASS